MDKNRPPKHLSKHLNRSQRASSKGSNIYQKRKQSGERLRRKSRPLWKINFDKKMDEGKTEHEKRAFEDVAFIAKRRKKRYGLGEELPAKPKVAKIINFYSFKPTIH